MSFKEEKREIEIETRNRNEILHKQPKSYHSTPLTFSCTFYFTNTDRRLQELTKVFFNNMPAEKPITKEKLYKTDVIPLTTLLGQH